MQSIGTSLYCRVAIEAIRNDLAHSVVRINCFAAARPRIGRGDPVAFSRFAACDAAKNNRLSQTTWSQWQSRVSRWVTGV